MCFNPVCLLTIISTLLSYIEGCGRTPATPSPTTPSPYTTASPAHHRQNCTANETTSQGCLNGGTCFVLELGVRTTICICQKDYAGKRCEYLDPNIIFQRERDSNIATAGIAASAVAATLFVTVLLLIVVYHRRYKRRKEKEKAKEAERSRNGGINTDVPFMDGINITSNPRDDTDSTHKDPLLYNNYHDEHIHNGNAVEGETQV